MKLYTEEEVIDFTMRMISQYEFGNKNIWNKKLLKESLNTELMRTVYKCHFGMEHNGKIELLPNGKYQCFETPMFGGDWMSVGNEFDNLDDAIKFIESLT